MLTALGHRAASLSYGQVTGVAYPRFAMFGPPGKVVPVRPTPACALINLERITVARVIVNVMPKAEILDPQGQAVVRALGRIGVSGVSDVRQGKRFELEVDGTVSDDQLDHIAATLLANTVIEEYDVISAEVAK